MNTIPNDGRSAPSVRKRHRSTECAFVGQSKQYVHENLINSQDKAKMREIYSKTVSLLFKGSSEHFSQLAISADDKEKGDSSEATLIEDRNRLQSVRLLGSGQYVAVNACNEPIQLPTSPDRRCECCARKSLLRGQCSSCSHQQLCEHCGFSCIDCNEPLCSSCVNLFACGTAENPCCSRCQLFR